MTRAKEISDRIGNHTVKSYSFNFDESGKPGFGLGESATPLLSPDEVLSLSKEKGILLVPGVRPILFDKTPWYKIKPFKGWAGENPHEKHPPCRETLLELQYGPDASNLCTPVLKDSARRASMAQRVERFRNYMPRAKLFRASEFLWLPLVAGMAATIAMYGTPHFLMQTYPQSSGYQCSYIGLSGVRILEGRLHCAGIQNIRFRSN